MRGVSPLLRMRSFVLGSLLVAAGVAQTPAPVAPKILRAEAQGRVEQHGDVLLLRVWGTPKQRGLAHGHLLAKEFAAVALPEFAARFARHLPLLEQARAAVGRLIEYPDDVQEELAGVWQGLLDQKVALRIDELDRDFDFTDFRIANALDVFGLMGCSSFTVWGDQALGGGVLTARNFDWPLTGEHMTAHTMLLVQHLPDGRAVASIGWPGYVGTVTGVSSDGVAAFLHVGTGKITYTPEPGSWPSAIAARAILASGVGDGGAGAFANAQKLLANTSPPAGFLTHVVLPVVPKDREPAAVFETDSRSCVPAAHRDGAFTLTNHFHTRADGRGASKDSKDREQRLQSGISGCFDAGDKQVSVEEAWQILGSVQRGGARAFGTLHALVFRHQPFCFELRIATPGKDGLVAAPASPRRLSLTHAQLFADGEVLGR